MQSSIAKYLLQLNDLYFMMVLLKSEFATADRAV